jgi:hypothetical protein
VADALEDTLLANGMAHADTALMAQNAFGARIEHARYFTVNDLAAMMSMQYDNQGLAALWPLIETAIMAPVKTNGSTPRPSRCCVTPMARHAWRLFDPAGWCAHYDHGKNDCDRLKGIYEQFLMRQRQMAAVLEAHGVPVLFVHCEAGQDARELLARWAGGQRRHLRQAACRTPACAGFPQQERAYGAFWITAHARRAPALPVGWVL